MCVYVAKKYLAKHIYVCLGGKIPWICMYIAKIPHKICTCLGSKIPHEKKKKEKKTRKRNKQMIMIKKRRRKKKNKLSS